MFENVAQNNGVVIAIVGLLFVFIGLVFIAIIISLFNKMFEKASKKEKESSAGSGGFSIRAPKIAFGSKKVPEDELVALTIALEIYRKLHFEQYSNKVTFTQGTSSSVWKTGFRYGQRVS